ncbi:hypothetical protein [Rhodovulum sp. P5]|uniref:hypothetical protein n=1 Tax=Rhodovulum phage vB_RhkS_P1 TaxID=1873452 RepID=UPI00080AC295|nr:hypothetical protein [Rhodovulum sp. P5]YP_009285913.1 hypothetical protein BI026_gp28 [Rhodovulum phage vB_RhkS_P1]ANT39899.1 hypothetical protein Rhks_28 [Rhodovulum phage vB_RhkS_P1]
MFDATFLEPPVLPPHTDGDGEEPDCPHCDGYGLRSEWMTINGRMGVATVPCSCPAGRAYRERR